MTIVSWPIKKNNLNTVSHNTKFHLTDTLKRKYHFWGKWLFSLEKRQNDNFQRNSFLYVLQSGETGLCGTENSTTKDLKKKVLLPWIKWKLNEFSQPCRTEQPVKYSTSSLIHHTGATLGLQGNRFSQRGWKSLRKLPFVDTVHTIESILYMIGKKERTAKNNTTISLHFSAYKHARVLMDIYLAFEISHIISPVCDHEGQKCEGDTGGRERKANSLLRAKIWEIHQCLSGKPRRIFPDGVWPAKMFLLRFPTRWHPSAGRLSGDCRTRFQSS